MESRFAEVNGVRLHYRISGSGPPIVLLHGYTQTGGTIRQVDVPADMPVLWVLLLQRQPV